MKQHLPCLHVVRSLLVSATHTDRPTMYVPMQPCTVGHKQQVKLGHAGKACLSCAKADTTACTMVWYWTYRNCGTFKIGVPDRNAAAWFGGTTVMPEGLRRGPARRAVNLPVATPKDIVKDSSLRTAALMLQAVCNMVISFTEQVQGDLICANTTGSQQVHMIFSQRS